MSNAQLQRTIIHSNEASTPSELVALNRRTLVLVLALAAFAAACWVAMLPRPNADIPRSVSFVPQSAQAPTAPSPFVVQQADRGAQAR